MTETTLTLADAQALGEAILSRAGAEAGVAREVAAALVAAEADGQAGHGLSRLPSYADQVMTGKVNGRAIPDVTVPAAAAVRVDARSGFAYPAIRIGLAKAAEVVRATGAVVVSITNTHHTGAVGHHVEGLARRGLIGLTMNNGPAGIAPWGGRRALYGTNPIAFAAPRRGAEPLVVDLSMSKVARGKINVAAQKGEAIPAGWALDAEGRPTTDAKAALAGTMLPMGDAKGAALVLVVEILSAALSGARFGYEASSFFTGEGEPPNVGQFFLVLDPGPFSAGHFADRLEDLLGAIEAQDGARIPGLRRLAARRAAAEQGVSIPTSLYQQLQARR
ncbi:MAG: Ldh family oxidoreductase [Alphaproteobacteria bacterium]|nr:Ldh family oxidoreductase [Alphaproteobacteria bacterium]